MAEPSPEASRFGLPSSAAASGEPVTGVCRHCRQAIVRRPYYLDRPATSPLVWVHGGQGIGLQTCASVPDGWDGEDRPHAEPAEPPKPEPVEAAPLKAGPLKAGPFQTAPIRATPMEGGAVLAGTNTAGAALAGAAPVCHCGAVLSALTWLPRSLVSVGGRILVLQVRIAAGLMSGVVEHAVAGVGGLLPPAPASGDTRPHHGANGDTPDVLGGEPPGCCQH